MTQPEVVRPAPFKSMDGEPAFDEAWQAQVLAMADSLIAEGRISASQWSETFGACLTKAEAVGKPDTIETYYASALSALELVLTSTGQVGESEIDSREAAWKRAYLETPHGQAVDLLSSERERS